MAADVLFADKQHGRVNSCLLQRSFQLGSQTQHSLQLDSNTLLAGGAPWEGVAPGLHSGSMPADPYEIQPWSFSRLAALPHFQQSCILCTMAVAVAIFVYLQTRGHTPVQNQSAVYNKRFRLCFHVVVLCISGFLRGYGLYVIGPFLTPIQRSLKLCFPCLNGKTDLALAACTCAEKEFAVSSVALGAIFGGLVGGWLADALGRRITLLATDVLFIVSSLVMAMSRSGKWAVLFFIGRILLGIAVGASGPASHAYISELVPPKYRGQLLTVAELALCLGCFAVFGFSGILGDAQWRRAVEFPALPALFQLICAAFFLYESPRWLAASGKSEEAEEVADALGLESFVAEQALARDPKVLKEKAGKEAQKLVSSIAAPVLDKRQRSWVGVLLQHRRRVFLALGCAVAHNALGANIVMYYSRDVLQLAGIANSVGSQVALGVAKALGTGVAFACVDRIGRRILLIAGVAGATLGHLGLAVAFWPGNIQPVAMLAWSSLMLFLAAWDMSWASLMSVVITEVLPDDVRGLGLGASCSLYWLVSFVQAQTLESLFKRITIGGTFATYAVGSIMSLLFVLLYVPETCGRPLEVE